MGYCAAVTYRDELEAAQSRADALERELSDARDKIASLEGKKTGAVREGNETALAIRGPGALERVGSHRWMGSPMRLELDYVLEGEMPESGYTELVEVVRKAFGNVGQVTLLPGSLTWSSTPTQGSTINPYVTLYVTVRDRRTRIVLEERLGMLAGGIYGGIGGGIGGGGIMLPIAVAWANPVLLAFSLPAWIGGISYLCFKMYRSQARKRAARFERLADRLVEIAERHIAAAEENE